jgi:glycosyltransferase involved in cell wall biosynthesis
LDAQHSVGTATGIGEYAACLGSALESCGIEIAPLMEPRLDPWRFDRRLLWDQVLLPYYAGQARADLLHCTAGTVPLLLPLPCVATVHDVAWLRVQSHARPYARAYFGAASLKLYRRVQRVIVSSRFSRDELLTASSIDPALISVVYPIVSGQYARLARAPQRVPFVLAVGTVERRKNVAIVIRALARLPGVQLIAVGPPTPYQRECEELAESLGMRDRVRFPGYVSREALLELYAAAAVAVAPSIYEGFGYAAAQALCAGVPLVASDASSLPEAVGDPSLLVGPVDADGWRDALEAILSDRASAEAAASARRSAAIERFAPLAAARATIAVYRDALAAFDAERAAHPSL